MLLGCIFLFANCFWRNQLTVKYSKLWATMRSNDGYKYWAHVLNKYFQRCRRVGDIWAFNIAMNLQRVLHWPSHRVVDGENEGSGGREVERGKGRLSRCGTEASYLAFSVSSERKSLINCCCRIRRSRAAMNCTLAGTVRSMTNIIFCNL